MAAPLYLLAAVVSALAYSAVDVSRKILVERVRPMPLLCVFSLGSAPLFALWWGWLGNYEVGAGYWLPGGVSVVLNIVSNVLFLEAVRVSPLSVTIPMLSLTPVFTTLLGVPMLGEVPSPSQAVGIALVVVGAFAINLGIGDGLSPLRAWRSLCRESGSLLMAIVALLWSVATPLDKLAMGHASPAFHGLALNAGVGVGVLLLLIGRGRTHELRLPSGTRWTAVGSIAGSTLAIGLYLVAISHLWVGLVESLKRGLGSAGALGLGRLLFRERIGRAQIMAVGLMIVGVVLVLV